MKELLLAMGIVLIVITGLAFCNFLDKSLRSKDGRKRFGYITSTVLTGFYFAYILWSFLWIWRMK